MPYLAYCIVDAGQPTDAPAKGVQDEPISFLLVESDLKCLYSRYHPDKTEDVRHIALTFHRVLQELLQQNAIIPFRFPAVVESEAELRTFVQQHAESYRHSLDKIRDSVQMEVQLRLTTEPLPGASKTESGTQYLQDRLRIRQKLASLAQELRQKAGTSAQAWRRRDSPTGTRCFALVARDSQQTFLARLKNFPLPPDVEARVTGPWPATEFLKDK